MLADSIFLPNSQFSVVPCKQNVFFFLFALDIHQHVVYLMKFRASFLVCLFISSFTFGSA